MRDEQGREYTKVTRGKTNPNAQPDAHGYIALAVADLAKQGRGSSDPVVQALCHADHLLVRGLETAPAPTMGREEAERMVDNLIAQAQHRNGHNAAEKGLPAARQALLTILLSRPDIHTEARKWGYIPGNGGLRNPATGERLDP